jgi:hypothetical protein
VQPAGPAGHLARYAVPAGLTNSTHLFIWETNRATFQSQSGSYAPAPAPANVISNWTYSLAMPRSGDEVVHINLWLNRGTAPTDKNEVEVIVKSFQFVPLAAPTPPRLSGFITNPARFAINSQPDRRYQFYSSSNLLDWAGLGVVLATNLVIDFADSISPALDPCFYRAAALP